MKILTLQDRIESYQSIYDYKLLPKLPVVIKLNGRGFKKVTSLLQKPYSPELQEIFCAIIIKLFHEIDGCVFVYSFNDEIIIVARNDQNHDTQLWYDGKIQNIVSAAASLATLEFNRLAEIGEINIIGDPIFVGSCFIVPNPVEAINTLVAKQQQAFLSSLSLACFYELIKRFDLDDVRKTLAERTVQEKLEILQNQCNIDFNKYPLPFRRGIATYRSLKVINSGYEENIKNKVIVDTELPIFTKDQNFLSGIFKSGRDIVRINQKDG